MIEFRGQFIVLKPNTPTTFTFDRLDDSDAIITDRQTGKKITVQRVLLHVTSVDGVNTDKLLSFLAKHAIEYLNELSLRGMLFTRPIRITKTGSGFLTQYSFEIL